MAADSRFAPMGIRCMKGVLSTVLLRMLISNNFGVGIPHSTIIPDSLLYSQSRQQVSYIHIVRRPLWRGPRNTNVFLQGGYLK